MMTKWVTPVSAVILALLFFVFCSETNRRAEKTARAHIFEHARVIADDLWNFNVKGASDYLNLAAESYGYESLVVKDHRGFVFWKINRRSYPVIYHYLIKANLISGKEIVSQITNGNFYIGSVTAVWLNTTVFLKAYVFFALVLILVVIHLYSRIMEKKLTLEDRVEKRTRDLLDANDSLVKEIEERKKAEEALRESETKHRFLAENISDVIWTMDMDMHYTYVSPVAGKIHGWSVEELKQLTIYDVLTTESLEHTKKEFEKQLSMAESTGDYNRSTTLILEMYSKDGSTVWCEIIASFIVNEQKKPVFIMGVTRDITDRIKAQKEKDMLQKQLDRSRKMESLGLLAGGVAHDLNNVLSGIVSYPELLLLDLPKDSPFFRPIQVIRDSGLKAAAIVEDLLTLARRGVPVHETIMLNVLIKDYLESPEHLKLVGLHEKIQVVTNLDRQIPNIKGSGIHIKKSLMNLVANAAEAQPYGGIIRITTQTRYLDQPLQGLYTVDEGEYVVLSVSDQGEGIGENDLQRIFEPFYTKKMMGRSGTGLGLAVVWGTAQDHKGYVTVSSRVGQGTEFDLYFPIIRGLVAEKEEQMTIESIMGDGEIVLVVDDIKDQREIATRILTRLNYQVHSAASGEEAVEYFRNHRVDFVVLDMIMGAGMDGLDTYKELIRIKPNQKAIIVSGYSETDRVKEAQHLGVADYVKKPYMLENIGRAVKKALMI